MFKKLHKKRKLTVIFDYLVHADKLNQPSEIRLLLLFTTLEGLKDTYAKELGLPYIDGFYRKPSKKQGKKGEAYKFEELLKMMMKTAGMLKGMKQIVELRNEIIHSGLSRKSNSQLWKMYERIQDIIREYLIRVLGYKGNLLTYSSRGMVLKKIKSPTYHTP